MWSDIIPGSNGRDSEEISEVGLGGEWERKRSHFSRGYGNEDRRVKWRRRRIIKRDDEGANDVMEDGKKEQ